MRNDRCVFSRSELYGRWCDDFGSGQPLHARIWAVCGICSIRAGGFDFSSIAKRRREAVSIAESGEGLGGFPLRRVFFFPPPYKKTCFLQIGDSLNVGIVGETSIHFSCGFSSRRLSLTHSVNVNVIA